MKKIMVFSSFITLAALGGIIFLLRNNMTVSGEQANVSFVDGRQIIRIDAKGGYSPRETRAKANTPTTLEVKTNGTYDCSTAIVIPNLNYRSYLPPSGITTIEIPPQPAGTTLKGLCVMGMYNFGLNFN